jgi:hypothetical protein
MVDLLENLLQFLKLFMTVESNFRNPENGWSEEREINGEPA